MICNIAQVKQQLSEVDLQPRKNGCHADQRRRLLTIPPMANLAA
jgi:hypothetical protein